MAVRSFRAVVGKDGPNPFVDVPLVVSRACAAFAERRRIRVAGTLQGHPLHATLVPEAGGVHRLYVSGGMRAATGVRVGDRVAIALRPERGKTRMVVYRDRVAFMVKVRFAGARPGRDHLDLGFWFTERDEDPRFSRIETIATNVHVHRVRIRAPAELDGAVRRWIDRAHRIGCREHLQPRP